MTRFVPTQLALLVLALLSGALSTTSAAAMPYERAGWQAELITRFHDVSGTVTIVDEFTLQVDDFHYDGTGLATYFYLDDPSSNEITFVNGFLIEPLLLRAQEPYEGESLTLDLGTHSLDGHRAISVWCVPVDVSFGDGIFENTMVPEPSAALLAGLGLGILSALRFRSPAMATRMNRT